MQSQSETFRLQPGSWVTRQAIVDVVNLADALDRVRLPGPGLPQGPLERALHVLATDAEHLVTYPAQLAEAADNAFAAFTEAAEAGPVVAGMASIATEFRCGLPRGTAGLGPWPQNPTFAAFEQLAHQLAAREIGYAITGMSFDNYDDAVQTRDTIIAVLQGIETVIADAGRDDLFSAMIELRVAITRMINRRAANLNPLVTYRAMVVPNALTLAWQMYQETDRDLEICERLSARNPGFLPVTGRILAADE